MRRHRALTVGVAVVAALLLAVSACTTASSTVSPSAATSEVTISGGRMHIRMFRTDSSVHSAAVVPKASIGLYHGKYVDRFRVDPDSDIGYGMAHLLSAQPMSWISQNQANLKAPWAAKNSHAQIDISSVAVYTYAGRQG